MTEFLIISAVSILKVGISRHLSRTLRSITGAIYCRVLVQAIICCKTRSCAILEVVNCAFFEAFATLIAMFFLSVTASNYGMYRHGRIRLEYYLISLLKICTTLVFGMEICRNWSLIFCDRVSSYKLLTVFHSLERCMHVQIQISHWPPLLWG